MNKIIIVLTVLLAALVNDGLLTSKTNRKLADIAVDIKDFSYQFYGQIHICGAAIISLEWAITAAHCINTNETRYYSFRSGASELKKTGFIHYAISLWIHPLYNVTTRYNDIALVEVGNEFRDYYPAVKPVKLAKLVPKNGAKVNVTGWGDFKFIGEYPKTLLKAELSVISQKTCKKAYKSGFITEHVICARTLRTKISCCGDSGGPLVVNGTLVGILSWNVGCIDALHPGVYTSIPVLRDWIRKISRI